MIVIHFLIKRSKLVFVSTLFICISSIQGCNHFKYSHYNFNALEYGRVSEIQGFVQYVNTYTGTSIPDIINKKIYAKSVMDKSALPVTTGAEIKLESYYDYLYPYADDLISVLALASYSDIFELNTFIIGEKTLAKWLIINGFDGLSDNNSIDRMYFDAFDSSCWFSSKELIELTLKSYKFIFPDWTRCLKISSAGGYGGIDADSVDYLTADFLSYLIGNGADINQTQDNQPLYLPTQVMLNYRYHYINVNTIRATNHKDFYQEASGLPPLLSAIANHRYESAKLLINQGAIKSVKDKKGLSVKDYLIINLQQYKSIMETAARHRQANQAAWSSMAIGRGKHLTSMKNVYAALESKVSQLKNFKEFFSSQQF